MKSVALHLLLFTAKRMKTNKGVYSLALASIYTTIASLFRRFDLELYETSRDDIDAEYDLFIPRPKNLKTLGVQVKVKDSAG